MSEDIITPIFDIDDFGLIKGGTEADQTYKCYGFASSPAQDFDGEQVIQKGLDIEPLAKHGFVDWNHHVDDVIGWVTDADFRVNPHNKNKEKGLYTEFQLTKGDPQAEKQYGKMLALEKAGCPRTFGLSVEGTRKQAIGGKVTQAVIYGLALTPYPKNKETSARAFMKSLLEGTLSFSELERSGERMFESDLIGRIVDGVSKAIMAGTDRGGTTQTGGAALARESLGRSTDEDMIYLDYSLIPDDFTGYTGDERRAMQKIKSKADANHGLISKAEAAILIHMVKGITKSLDFGSILRALDFSL